VKSDKSVVKLKTFIFVWKRSGWAASKIFYWPVSEH